MAAGVKPQLEPIVSSDLTSMAAGVKPQLEPIVSSDLTKNQGMASAIPGPPPLSVGTLAETDR